jgi:uncharacterized protein YjiS (DUF1127 family)
MTALHNSSSPDQPFAIARHRTEPLSGLGAVVLATLQLYRERQRQRRELALLCDLGLRDTGLSRDLIAHEARKWPWQKWHPRLHQFEVAAQARAASMNIEEECDRWASKNGAS